MLKGFVSGEEKDIIRIPMLVGNEYKEGWEVRDNQDRLIWGREDELQTTTGSLKLKGYGLPVKVKSLLGNGVQNGTPTPDAPIEPEFCGERTGNLWNGVEYIKTSLSSSETWTYSEDLAGSVYRVPCKPNTTYTLYLTENISLTLWRIRDVSTDAVPTAQSTSVQIVASHAESVPSGNSTTFTTSQNAKYILFQTNASLYSSVLNCIMLIEGSTIIPYEPYGYKIPVTNAGQTVPIYLGQTQTIRKIGKVDLASLSWTSISSGLWRSTSIQNIKYVSSNEELGNGMAEKYNMHTGKGMSTAVNCIAIDISQILVNTGDGTVKPSGMFWYALAEPETAIVNEPLYKIGDYADELNDTVATLPEITTTTGQNTLTVDTTLAPSSLTIKGHIKEQQPENLLPVSKFEDLSDPSWWSGGYYIRYNNMPAGTYVMSTNMPEKDPGDVYFNGENALNVPYEGRPVSMTINEGGSFYVLFFIDRGGYEKILDGTFVITLVKSE